MVRITGGSVNPLKLYTELGGAEALGIWGGGEGKGSIAFLKL